MISKAVTLAPQPLGPVQGAKNTEYHIPGVGTIMWAHHLGGARMLLDWSGTLTALKESDAPAYQALYAQAEQFFKGAAQSFNGDMPEILPVMVPRAGRILGLPLGDFYQIRCRPNEKTTCIIPDHIKVGEW